MGPLAVATASDLTCTVQGTKGDDEWVLSSRPGGIAVDAVVCGGKGNDTIHGPNFVGTFYGGTGDDFLQWLDAGTFEGGPGFDEVFTLTSGIFIPGPQ